VRTLSENNHYLCCSLVLSHCSLGLDPGHDSILVVDKNSSQVDSYGHIGFTSSMNFNRIMIVLQDLLAKVDVELEVAIVPEVDQVGR